MATKSRYLTIPLADTSVPSRKSSPVGATIIGDYLDASGHRVLVLERPLTAPKPKPAPKKKAAPKPQHAEVVANG